MVMAPCTILGGLPVIADVSFGYDGFTGEHYSEVNALYWARRDGKPGKELSQKLRDRAEAYDPYFSCVIEQVSDWLAMKEAPC